MSKVRVYEIAKQLMRRIPITVRQPLLDPSPGVRRISRDLCDTRSYRARDRCAWDGGRKSDSNVGEANCRLSAEGNGRDFRVCAIGA